MKREELQHIFKSSYNAAKWQEVLIEHFGARDIRVTPQILEGDNNENIEGVKIGQLKTSDGYDVGLFAFEIKQGHKIKLNRVGLRSLVQGYTRLSIDAAIAVYYDRTHWRLSYICDLDRERNTSPKRFTYVFGDSNESYRTASKMLGTLSGNTPSLQNIRDAFSVEALSDSFFYGYRDRYKKFCDKIGADKKEHRDYVKKLLGRLVFLQFLQKKGWMGVPTTNSNWEGGDAQYTQNLVKRHIGEELLLTNVLEPLFFKTLNEHRTNDIATQVLGENIKIPYLNGGLFDKDSVDDQSIDFPYEYFAELMDFFSQYNFTIDENDPNDAEVGIDPEMLGRIFENLLEDNKDKGTFYTPKEIVQFMCRQSLLQYINSKTEPELHSHISELINRHIVTEALQKPQNARIVDTLLRDVKICDPAIGSGAFPMGLLNEIFSIRKLLYGHLGNNENFSNAEVKKEIIQNCIYGVDIEQGAVDIARLRFWLSLVVDEVEPQPLPNLDYKIMQGDSLVERFEGIDLSKLNDQDQDDKAKEPERDLFGNLIKNQLEISFESKGEVKELRKNIKRYFTIDDHDDKERIRQKIERAVFAIIDNCIVRFRDGKQELVSAFVGSLNAKQAKTKDKLDKAVAEAESKRGKLKEVEKSNEKPFFLWKIYFADVFDKGGFDIVIANPPYVSTKGVTDEAKKVLTEQYGFTDDLYYHFILRGFELLRADGVMTMITPDTYFTTLTKKNLRKLLLENTIHSLVHLGHDVFDAAMVSTAIFVAQKRKFANSPLGVIDARGKKKLAEASYFDFSQSEYGGSINGSFFVPSETNLKLHRFLAPVHNKLITEHWDKIETAREISRNEIELDKYRDSLKAGDWTLVGLVTEGGQGLATANNGRFVGVRSGTKEAERINQTRIAKLTEVNKKHKTNYIMPDVEAEIWLLFESIKERYGRDVFGQGYLYKVVPNELIADVDILSEAERKDGIKDGATFVPYDKGDKDGNRWYLESPYLIDWSTDNVHFLKSNSGKKGEGMPVVRNPQFYFREGFCYSDIKTFFIRCRLKGKSVHDVKSMSLFPTCKMMPYYYIISVINSHVIAQIINSFMNNTPSFQINDCRALPIPVPNAEQLAECKGYFDAAVKVQQDYFRGTITPDARDTSLATIQSQIDEMVYKLYSPQSQYFNDK